MKKIIKNENNTPIIICKNNKTLVDELLNEFVFLVIENTNLVNKELIIEKVKNNTYNDIVYLKGKSIKKEQLKEIYIQFSTMGIESHNLKFLFIDNIEECSLNILNSLLKFIEEPPKGLWILLLTNNIHKVIPTIKSRCLIQNQNQLLLDISWLPQSWIKYHKNIINAFSTKQEITDFLNTDESNKILEFINLYKTFYSQDFFQMLNIFKELDYLYILILFKIIYVFNDNKNIFILINNINLNPNKTLIFYKLLEGKIKDENNMCNSNT